MENAAKRIQNNSVMGQMSSASSGMREQVAEGCSRGGGRGGYSVADADCLAIGNRTRPDNKPATTTTTINLI